MYFGDESNDTGLAPVQGFGGPVPIYAHVYACFGNVWECELKVLEHHFTYYMQLENHPKIFKCALCVRRYAAGCYAALRLTTGYT